MSFFDNDDDPFEEIVRGFFGGRPGIKRQGDEMIMGEEEDRTIDYIEDDKKIYLIFEFPGYDEKDILIIVNNGELKIKASKRDNGNIQGYLVQGLSKGLFIKKILPKFINPKGFTHTMRNGVLEIIFNKK